jgi:hypothetical protein
MDSQRTRLPDVRFLTFGGKRWCSSVPDVPRSEPLALSIVIPAFNEAARLVDSTLRLGDAIANGAIDPSVTEFILVDDGSTDETGHRAEQLFAKSFPHSRVLRLQENSGKGAAIRAGVAAAAAPVVAFIDADMAVDPEQIPTLVATLDDSDFAIGSRALPESIVHWDSIRRVVMGGTFNRLVNAITKVGFSDTQCGFKAFRTPVARILFHSLAVDRFAFDVELLCIARRLGLRITEVPVHWNEMSGSTVRPIADPLSMVLDVLRIQLGKPPAPIPSLAVYPGIKRDGRAKGEIASLTYDAVGKTLPVLRLPQDGALILFPLCESTDLQRLPGRLGELAPTATMRRCSVSLAELSNLAPLRLLTQGGSEEGSPHNACTFAPSATRGGRRLATARRPAPNGRAGPGPSFVVGS